MALRNLFQRLFPLPGRPVSPFPPDTGLVPPAGFVILTRSDGTILTRPDGTILVRAA
jgi:hypothetical protein